MAIIGLALCTALIAAALIYLRTGKRIRWMFRKPDPRAEALSVVCSGLGGWIVLGTIYLHATRERDQAIAAGMGKLLTDAKKGRQTKGTGTQRARCRGSAS